MARRIAYQGDPVITLDDVALQCRVEPEDLQRELIEQVIIPGVTAQAEQRTGAAIRQAEYEEEWPESYGSGHALDVGQASEVLSVKRVLGDGTTEDLTDPRRLERGQRESFLHFPNGRPAGVLRIRYKAGYDPAAYPGVKLWLLMSAATAHEYRETLITGTILAELPSRFTDSLLAEIEVPPRF
ncbi:hypothetical protein SA496_01215 [Pseudomonas sp. JS3066]|uniref:hypothetical protein n=1 Tax=Pseudomonas sp. JS3066 TaxID=3090665 RepID=UPI002E7B6394|nr:hypothetical protein [Pseudomonas sp. JS3066]WVK93835.1 hypothetical protein SA496_01215 [Pseudomonas sp. JS3066]